ncbi:MAG TPA: ATP-binding protein [Pyrinomonadaceae bacterium]|nr:ATP-binding protein [Pyrinomonadaceae bacterium]
MSSQRVLFIALLAVGLVLVIIAFILGFSSITIAVGMGVVAGLIAGLMLSRRLGRKNPTGTLSHEQSAPATDFSPKLLDIAINEMREGVLVIDAEMRVVASNRAARHVFSSVHEEIQARRLTELTRNPAIYDAFLDAVHGIERGGVKVETYENARRVFDLRVVPLRSASGGEIVGAVGVLFDITRLERLENVRQEFLSNVSHELRTPLTSIMALAETLETGALDDAGNNRRFLSIIQKNAKRMQHLIDDILELSAIEAGNVSVNPEVIQLRSLVEDVVSTLSSPAAARNISVHNLIESDAKVFADPHRLMQMLTNLIDNAIKFNRDEGTVTIAFERAQRDRITVTDTGEGLAGQHIDRVFERFYRVDRARSRELGGTGLGLAIVKHLARAHQGEVTVSSRVGEGTQFTIELPSLHTAKPIAQATSAVTAK